MWKAEASSSAAPVHILLDDLQVSPIYVQPGQAVSISTKVINDGGVWVSCTGNLMINGQLEQSAHVGVSPGTAQPLYFTFYRTEPGEYTASIGRVSTEFYVLEPETAPTVPQGGALDSGGVIAIIAIAVIVLGGITFALLLTRRI
jgi:hypothetical protein